MLRKLLKYDLLSVWRNGWGTIVVMMVCTVATTLFARVLNGMENSQSGFRNSMEVVGTLTIVLGLFCLLGCIATVGILVFWRFYKNFFTDEGYLTFTLPVKRSTLLISKMLNSAIWLIAYAVLFVLCVVAYCTFGGFKTNVAKEVFEGLLECASKCNGWQWAYTAVGTVSLASYLFLYISQFQFAIALGSSISKKAKVLSTVCVLLVTELVCSFLMPGGLGEVALSTREMLTGYWRGDRHEMVVLIMLVLAVMRSAVGLAFTYMTLDKISRKLNIE